MSKIFVALWSRDTEHKLNVSQQTRLAKLGEALDEADRLFKAERGTSTDYSAAIKAIFVAPEYLFTREREENALDPDRALTVQQVRSVRKELLRFSLAKPEMLMVPGTVIYKYEPEKHKGGRQGATELLKTAQTLATDTASKFKQVKVLAPANPTDDAPTIQTKIGLLEGNGEIHHFVRNKMFVLLNGQIVAQYSKMADMKEAIGQVPGVYLPGKKCGLETIEGLTFGFEICYDHEIGVLKAMAKTSTVDFHIIASAFVTNEKGNMIAKAGRFILHASSNATYSNVMYKQKTGLPVDASEVGEDIIKTLQPVEVDGDSLKCYVVNLV